MVGSIIFLIVAIAFLTYSLFTTVEVTEIYGKNWTVKSRLPLFVTNLNLYLGIYMALVSGFTILFVYAQYCLLKAIRLYLEKKPGDITRNELRNSRKAIFKGVKNGFTEEGLNGWTSENNYTFPQEKDRSNSWRILRYFYLNFLH